jgi:pilus assembly protein Flp/PilA
MQKLRNFVARFRKDESGAALIEYTVLIGLITVAVIATVIVVGGWVGTQWTSLSTALATAGGAAAGGCFKFRSPPGSSLGLVARGAAGRTDFAKAISRSAKPPSYGGCRGPGRELADMISTARFRRALGGSDSTASTTES